MSVAMKPQFPVEVVATQSGPAEDKFDALRVQAMSMADTCDTSRIEVELSKAEEELQVWEGRKVVCGQINASAAARLAVAQQDTARLRALFTAEEAETAALEAAAGKERAAHDSAPAAVATVTSLLDAQHAAQQADLASRVAAARADAVAANAIYDVEEDGGDGDGGDGGLEKVLEARIAELKHILSLNQTEVMEELYAGKLNMPFSEALLKQLHSMDDTADAITTLLADTEATPPATYPERYVHLKNLIALHESASQHGCVLPAEMKAGLADEAMESRMKEGHLRETSDMADRMEKQLNSDTAQRDATIAKKNEAAARLAAVHSFATEMDASVKEAEEDVRCFTATLAAHNANIATQHRRAEAATAKALRIKEKRADLEASSITMKRKRDESLVAMQHMKEKMVAAKVEVAERLQKVQEENLPGKVLAVEELTKEVEKMQQAQLEQQVAGSYEAIAFPPCVLVALETLGAPNKADEDAVQKELASTRPALQKCIDSTHHRRLSMAEARKQHVTARINEFHAASEERHEESKKLKDKLAALLA